MGKARKPVPTYNLSLALDYLAAIVDKHGYVSKHVAAKNPGTPATASQLKEWLSGPEDKFKGSVTSDHFARAQGAYEFLRQLLDSNPTKDFDRTMARLLTGGYRGLADSLITDGDLGYLSYVYRMMELTKDREESLKGQKESAVISEFMGEFKVRKEFFVKVVGYREVAEYNVFNIKDRKGNLGVFFSSDGMKELGLEMGDCFLARMTPKKHQVSNYHGGKETIFNRVKVLQVVGK